MRMIICSFLFLIFISLPAYSAMTTKTYMERKTNVAGAGMATAGQIAKYVADGATGEMKLVGAAASDISGVLGAMSVRDILTGTDTENKLASAQTINAAMGGYATTAGTSTAYTATIPGFVLQDGAKVRLKIHTTNSASATLNVSGTGAKNMTLYTGVNIPYAYFYSNMVADFVYDNTSGKWMIVSAVIQGASDGIRQGNAVNFYRYSGSGLKSAILNYGGAAITTAGTAAAYTITDTTNYTSTAAYLDAGTKVVVKMHLANAASATLNLNALGAKAIFFNGAAIAAGMLQLNGTYTFVYDGTNWNVVQAPGVIPLTPAECLDTANRCLLAYGDTDLVTAGIQGPGYIWEVVDR